MSTIQVTNIKHASANTNNIELDSGGAVTLPKVNSINNGPLAGFRNAIINGGMEIAQRGTSGTSGYLIDRWLAVNTSAQSQSSDVPDGFLNSLEFTSDVATTPLILQRIERINSYHLAGQTCTVSFWAKNVSGSSFLAVQIFRAGANDNFSSTTEEHSVILSMSPSTSWVKYAATFTLSSAATTGLQIIILRNDDSAASTRVTGVQLEAGPVATPFERRPIGTELALCQRYFETEIFSGATNNDALFNAGGTATKQIFFATSKRATPTLIIEDGAGTSNRFNSQIGISGTDGQTISGGSLAIVLRTNGFVTDFVSGAATNRFSFNWNASAEL
jgi:hypothetical protein